MTQIAWLHDDNLHHWFGNLPALYVFDDLKLAQEQWSLKRVGFIYECLLDLPVVIRRGDPAAESRAFQREHASEKIITLNTPDPWLQQQINSLRAETTVEVLDVEPFVELSGAVDLKRFSRYWMKVERVLALKNQVG